MPLRRVNQAYVIATSKKLNVAAVNVPATVDDSFFKAEKSKLKQGEEAFMALKAAKTTASDDRKKVQQSIDAAIKLNDQEKAYLKSRFSLSRLDRPHEMKF